MIGITLYEVQDGIASLLATNMYTTYKRIINYKKRNMIRREVNIYEGNA
jgi:hypothetical protein